MNFGVLLKLCLDFIKVGAFSFGGGYACLAFIQRELVGADKWLSKEEFVNMVAIAQMTPGSTAINASTCVGFDLFGVLGGLMCAISVMLVPFILVLLVAIFYSKVRNSPLVRKAFSGIRPAAVGIVLSACVTVAESSIIGISSLIFVGLGLLLVGKLKVTPILTLIICGALGGVFYSILGVAGIAI